MNGSRSAAAELRAGTTGFDLDGEEAAQPGAGEAVVERPQVKARGDLAQLVVHVGEQGRPRRVLHDDRRAAVDPAGADDVVRVDGPDAADPAVDEVAGRRVRRLAAPDGVGGADLQ